MNDTDLSKRFAELRAQERASVPAFDTLLERPVPNLLRYRTALAFAALVLMLLVPAFVISTRPAATLFTAEEQSAARSLAQWQPPTAFLLRTPGSDLLGATPSIPDPQTRSVIHAAQGVYR